MAQDTRKAFDAFLRAARARQQRWTTNLGSAYHRGVGVPGTVRHATGTSMLMRRIYDRKRERCAD